MRLVYSPRYELSLPGHIWPTSKYRLIADALVGQPGADFVEPRLATWDELALVHAPEYLDRLRHSTLTAGEIATLELPWQPELADAFRLMVGGTCLAVAAALADGVSAHIGGGLHHAFAGHGEGFCPLNDIAVAVRVAQRGVQGDVLRAAVIDLDVHHGNGTAMIFEQDPDVFTCSVHQQHNYPAFKPRSDLDIGLRDGARDDEYLDAVRRVAAAAMASTPGLVIYVAGADPYAGDRLGGLAVTKNGLAERDRLVVDAVRGRGVPLALVLAGGYAADVQDTVDIQAATIRTLLARV